MSKLITKEAFAKKRDELEKENKKIGLCHGVFDLVHPGHIIHFEEAKEQVDILVVSITGAKFIRKGPDRPYFDDDMRVKFLSSLEMIDYVLVSDMYTVDDIVEAVKPHFYIKGAEYKVAEDDLTGNIDKEATLVKKYGGDMYYTSGDVFSSTKLINNAFGAINGELRNYIYELKAKYTFDDIISYIDKLKDLKILVVGDTIIDEYVFVKLHGIMSKDVGYSTSIQYKKQYLGGVLAVARQISEFSDKTTLISAVGMDNEINSQIKDGLDKKLKLSIRQFSDYETIVKTKFIIKNEKRDELKKLFATTNLKENKISKNIESEILSELETAIKSHDVVVVCDFGHGLISNRVQRFIESEAKFLTVNCQTNSSNYGMNLIKKYNNLDTYSLDEKELKLSFLEEDVDNGIVKINKHFKTSGFLTVASKGAMAIDENGKSILCPAVTLNVTDTIGAGDAFYSLCSILSAINTPQEVNLFLSNVLAGLATRLSGNEKEIEKVDLLKYISTLYNI